MKNYKLTIIGCGVAISIWLVSSLFDLDLFEGFVDILKDFEEIELDELIIPFFIFFFFAFLDFVGKQRSQQINIEKVKIYKAMLFSTHHVLNNFLNQMQLFKLTAEKTEGFPKKVLNLYDQSIRDAVVQIEAMGSIVHIDEKKILASVNPQPEIGHSSKSEKA